MSKKLITPGNNGSGRNGMDKVGQAFELLVGMSRTLENHLLNYEIDKMMQNVYLHMLPHVAVIQRKIEDQTKDVRSIGDLDNLVRPYSDKVFEGTMCFGDNDVELKTLVKTFTHDYLLHGVSCCLYDMTSWNEITHEASENVRISAQELIQYIGNKFVAQARNAEKRLLKPEEMSLSDELMYS